MSSTISSEITRISGAKDDIADAIEIKGVTVPSGSKIDDMAALILQISSGGGSGIVITETDDPAGGKVLEVTAVDLSDDTVRADKLVSGYTAHDSTGTAITGSLTPGITPTGTISINQNGTGIDVAQYAYADVSVSGGSPNLEDLTNIDPTESSQTITADTGYDGLNSVQINAISSTYVGSGIDRNDSTDLSVSGATVSVPAGYYASNASKSVASGTVTAPASISGSSASVSTGTNTLTLSKTISVTPSVTTAGYVSSGTAGNTSVSLTASVTTKAAATITPTKSTQTIASGTYLTGTQTIAAIPNDYQDVTAVDATATDVVYGKKIVNSSGTVVTGSLVIQHYYTGSGTPSSGTGVNGDIYLKTS